jgi:hypothetical protein
MGFADEVISLAHHSSDIFSLCILSHSGGRHEADEGTVT